MKILKILVHNRYDFQLISSLLSSLLIDIRDIKLTSINAEIFLLTMIICQEVINKYLEYK
jgi:hypothetical protein